MHAAEMTMIQLNLAIAYMYRYNKVKRMAHVEGVYEEKAKKSSFIRG